MGLKSWSHLETHGDMMGELGFIPSPCSLKDFLCSLVFYFLQGAVQGPLENKSGAQHALIDLDPEGW